MDIFARRLTGIETLRYKVTVMNSFPRAQFLRALLAGAVLLFTSCAAPGKWNPYSTRFEGAWSNLRIGMEVYTADDGYGSAQTLTVCPTPEVLLSSGQSRAQCLHIRCGTPAIVKRIIFQEAAANQYFNAPIIEISALNNSWKGFVDLQRLQPFIRSGTILTMVSGELPVQLYKCAKNPSCARQGVDIGDTVRVKVLQYHPEMSRGQTLLVRVLSGSRRGAIGWMDIQETREAFGNPMEFGWHYRV